MAELTITRDREELERLEGVIEENIGAFYKVGKALMKIRDEKLYEKVRGIENFETYCRKRWDFNSSRARQLIAATETADNIKSVTNSNTIESETHLRPLVKLKDNPEKQREAWQRAVETAPEGKVTAAHVQKVVKTYQLKGGDGGGRRGVSRRREAVCGDNKIDPQFKAAIDGLLRQIQNMTAMKWESMNRKTAISELLILVDIIRNQTEEAENA